MAVLEQRVLAPEIQASEWINTDGPLTLSGLRGKVVVIEAFQMLCPGCVSHGLPLAQELCEAFPKADVQVLGLHSVFEHHEAMTPVSLKAFLHEYRVTFPVAVDQAGEGPLPLTMQAYQLRGTPSVIVIDRSGYVRISQFGQVSGIRLAARIAGLIHETADSCGPSGCTV